LPNGQYLLCTETETKTNYIPFVVVKWELFYSYCFLV
jgi:hypothetical protein